jgi:hypothetical protein
LADIQRGNRMIDCRPQGICSWNYYLTGDGWQASLRIGSFGEQGCMQIGGRNFDIRKHGFASGLWTAEIGGQPVLTARKCNPFSRTIEIAGAHTQATLQCASVFSRTMMLIGPDTHCEITPRHPFTRRAVITGRSGDIPLTCFAFWLTAVLWRRAARSNNGPA